MTNRGNPRHRRSIRLRGYDYTRAGAYFVTICVQGRETLLGEVVGGEMRPSAAGGMVQRVWDELPARYAGVAVDAFAVMPNHVHGIILLTADEAPQEPVGAAPCGRPDAGQVGAAHGGRWQVEEGPPVVDLAIAKGVVPQAALPGATITYTLVYTNVGNALARGVVISDVLPAEIEATGYSSWGAPVAPLAGSGALAWQVAELAPGEGGVITVTGVLSPALTGTLVVTNTAAISAPLEARPGDNLAEAVLQVILGLASRVLAFLRRAQ